MKKQVDRYKEYCDQAAASERKLTEYLAERTQCQRTGRPTGKADSIIKYEIGNAEYELKNIEKLAYEYDRNPQAHPEVSDKEREKRLARIAELKAKLDKAIKAGKEVCGIELSG